VGWRVGRLETHSHTDGVRSISIRVAAFGEPIRFLLRFAITDDGPSSLPSASASTVATHHNYRPRDLADFKEREVTVTTMVMACCGSQRA